MQGTSDTSETELKEMGIKCKGTQPSSSQQILPSHSHNPCAASNHSINQHFPLTRFPFLVKKIWAVCTSKDTGSMPQPIRSPELHFDPNCRPLARPLYSLWRNGRHTGPYLPSHFSPVPSPAPAITLDFLHELRPAPNLHICKGSHFLS